ncbi:MAG: hypothetical protein WDM86_18895 [Rhizomicrobium sp.]
MSGAVELGECQAYCDAGQPDRAPLPAPRPADHAIRLWNACPWSDAVTAYDLRNVHLYNELLNAEAQGASLREMASAHFRIGVDAHPGWALHVVSTHLERAHWMQDSEFAYLDR